MPEGRMLKKVISESKSLGNLRSDSARLLYTWIIPFLDVEGRHSADPEIIKGHVFPKVKSMTIAKIGRLLPELAAEDLIILYRNDGESYLQLTKFHEHQKLDPLKEGKSKIPAPKPEDIENNTTPENSGPTPEKSSLSKVKLSKVQVKRNGRIRNESDPLFEPRHLELAKFLEDKVRGNVPYHKFTGINYLEFWAREFRLMEEKDKIPFDMIQAVLGWALEDDFWKINILSAGTFREKFGRLAAKMKDVGSRADCRKPDPPHIGASTKPDKSPEYWAEVRRLKAKGLEGQALTDALAGKAQEGKHENTHR